MKLYSKVISMLERCIEVYEVSDVNEKIGNVS